MANEATPITVRQTLAFAIDLYAGDKLARQVDRLNLGPRVDLRVVTTPQSKDNGKLLVSATKPQLILFNIGLEFQENATKAGVSEERLTVILPDVLQGALSTLNGTANETVRAARINEYLDLQRTRYGF
jgi:hypothetical protein